MNQWKFRRLLALWSPCCTASVLSLSQWQALSLYFKNSIRTGVKSLVMDLPSRKRKRFTFTNEFKVKVCEYAEKHGNRPAAREYGLDESNIRWWWKKKEEMQKQPKPRRVGLVRGAQCPELLKHLVDKIGHHSQTSYQMTLKSMWL